MMTSFELFSRRCMVAGLNFSPQSDQKMISGAFSYDFSAKKVSFNFIMTYKNYFKYFTGYRKVEPGANVIKNLFKEGIEGFSKRSGSGRKPERIIIFCSRTGEEKFCDLQYLKSAISSISEGYK